MSNLIGIDIIWTLRYQLLSTSVCNVRMCPCVNTTAHCSVNSPQAGGCVDDIPASMCCKQNTAISAAYLLHCDLPPAHSAGATPLLKQSIFNRREHV